MSNAKSKKDVKYVGVDDGHSGTKVFAGYDSVSKKPIQMVMPSIVSKGAKNFTNADQALLDDATIFVEGEQYTIGSKFGGNGDDLVGDSYPTSGQNVALITQALRTFIPNWGGSPVDVSIVTGLPLGHYFDKVEEQPNYTLINAKKENIERLSSAYSPADNKKPMFNLVRNSVQPEGWGSLLDAILTDKGTETEQFHVVSEFGAVVIDIGGRTVDTMIVLAEAMTPEYEDVHTYDLGILYMHRKLNDTIMQLEGLKEPIKRLRLEEVIRTGKFGRGNKERDYSDLVEKTLNNHTQKIFEQLKAVISRSEVEGGVIITGGGAELLGSRLKVLIEEYNKRADVFVPVDPVFSNARGFWKTAIMANQNGE
ncbi:MAG: ParM/StbA family protein [Psychrobacter sp.]|nr:ParM/StbA family protein [Psychrobacter sp.]